MKKILIFVIAGFGVAALFNNCSKVGFSEAVPGGSATSLSSASGDEGSPVNASDADLLRNLPPEEQGIYRPISDLEDPVEGARLAEIYRCPDNNSGILLCHFPSSQDAEHTICVGSVNAALTHSGHELTVDANGMVQGDYLGPCKQVPVQ